MKRLFYGLMLLFAETMLAQAEINAFLGSPVTDEDYLAMRMTAEFIDNNRFTSPWFRELDFRMRSNDRELGLEEYRLRLGLLNPFEIRANRQFERLLNEQKDFQRTEVLNDVLLQRYEQLLEHYFLSRRLELLKQKEKALDKYVDLMVAINGNLEDLLDLEEVLTRSGVEKIGLTKKLELLDREISPQSNNGLIWDFELKIPSDLLWKFEDGSDSLPSILERRAQQKLQLEQQELKINKAEAFSNIGFVQGEFENEKFDPTFENWGFQVGIQIPIFNKDRPDLQRRRLSLLETEAKAATAGTQNQRIETYLMNDLNTLFTQYQWIRSRWIKLETFKDLNRQTDQNLKFFMKLTNYQAYLNQQLLEIKCDWLLKNIRIHHARGLLPIQPLINMLALERITFDWSEEP